MAVNPLGLEMLLIKEIVKYYQTTISLRTPIDSSYLYNVQARIVRVINETDHYWYETSVYIPNQGARLQGSTAAPTIEYAEKSLISHLEDLQLAVLNGEELMPNIFFKS